MYRKDAITNVQIKPNSSHDEKVKYGVFKGFVHRAMTICSEKYVKDELELLVKMFVENGYSEKPLRNIIKNYKFSNNTRDPSNRKKIVSLPYVSTISKKLTTVFKKAGFTTVFKSGRNLSSILTSRNKDQLPKNSYPGVYRAPCYCKRRYVGHTGKQTRTREKEHEKAVFNGSSKSAVGEHSRTCPAGIDWDNFVTIAAIPQYYPRAIREALEIQREEVGNSCNIIENRQAGQYVTTETWKPLLKKLGTPKDKFRAHQPSDG